VTDKSVESSECRLFVKYCTMTYKRHQITVQTANKYVLPTHSLPTTSACNHDVHYHSSYCSISFTASCYAQQCQLAVTLSDSWLSQLMSANCHTQWQIVVTLSDSYIVVTLIDISLSQLMSANCHTQCQLTVTFDVSKLSHSVAVTLSNSCNVA